jgi:WD repeat-containing protein 61
MAMSSETGQIYIFDLETGALTTTFTSHAMSVRSVAWSPDSSVRIQSTASWKPHFINSVLASSQCIRR